MESSKSKNSIQESEEKFISTLKNDVNILNKDENIKLSNANKNINNLLSNQLKSFTKNNDIVESNYNILKDKNNLIKNNIKKNRNNLIEVKTPKNSSKNKLLELIFNRMHSTSEKCSEQSSNTNSNLLKKITKKSTKIKRKTNKQSSCRNICKNYLSINNIESNFSQRSYKEANNSKKTESEISQKNNIKNYLNKNNKNINIKKSNSKSGILKDPENKRSISSKKIGNKNYYNFQINFNIGHPSSHSSTPKSGRKNKSKNKLTFISFNSFRSQNIENITDSNSLYKKTETVLQSKNLLNMLQLNQPKATKVEETNKIMDIIAISEIQKKIKASLNNIDKNEIKKEMSDLETSEICQEIEKLPIMKNKKNENYLKLKNKLNIFLEKNRFLQHKSLIYDSLDDEEMEEDMEINYLYIEPNSITVYIIDSVILISSLIELIYVPIFLAHNPNFCRNFKNLNQTIFFFIDILYILDFFTEFFRAFYNFDELLITKKKEICLKYINSWFFLDLIQAIPFFTILNMFENKCISNDIYNSNYYNINLNKKIYILLIFKIIKIFKVSFKNTIFKKIRHLLNKIECYSNSRLIIYTLLIVFISMNITSCLFIFFGRNSYPGWIVGGNMQNKPFCHIYLNAIYYLMETITTVGYGDIYISSICERIFQIIILIVGTIAYSWMITYISNYIKKIQEKSMDYEKKIQILEEIKISHPNFSKNLYDKILRHLKYNRYEKKDSTEIIINCLPYPLRNTLFMEMYKSIIKNFNFFKSFENSNFIVKVVTSLKSVLSIKGDIIMQENDFVEDIIFVKEGILSLEKCIDMNFAKESIEAYLNEVGFGKTTINTNYSKYNDNIKKYIKIIYLRKDEHYGDTLMFLNERTPFSVKVKSKKAELFFLSKTQAIEISTLYPNIWKKLLKKSLYNMNQIKKLSKKILIIFSERNGISLNKELCNNLNLNKTTTSIATSISKLSEYSGGINKSSSFEKNNKKVINSIIYEEDNENIDSVKNNIAVNKSTLLNSSDNQNYYSQSTKNIGCCEVSKSMNFNNLSSKNNKSNFINRSSYDYLTNKTFKTNPKIMTKSGFLVNITKNSESTILSKIEKNTEERNKSIFQFSTELANIPKSTEIECNEINCELYPNEKFMDTPYLKRDFFHDKNLSNSINKNNNNNFFSSLNNNNCLNNNSSSNSPNNNSLKNNNSNINFPNKNYSFKNNNHNNIFSNLSISISTNITINSSYENIDSVTKNKFSKDINFQKRIIQLVIDEYFLYENDNTRYTKNNTNVIPVIKINNSCYSPPPKRNNKNSMNLQPLSPTSQKSKSRKSRNDLKINLLNISNPHISKKNERNKSGIIKSFRTNFFNTSMKNLPKIQGKSSKKLLYSNEKNEDELSFYNKMKTLRGSTNNIITVPKDKKKINYLDKINHNINENTETLNNPQEFYTKFFTNILQNQIISNNKTMKNKDCNKKKVSLKSIDEKKKIKKERNLLNVSMNIEKNQILKRNAASSKELEIFES